MNSDRCQVPRPAPLVLHLLKHFGQQGFDLYFRRTRHQGLDRRSLPQLLIGYGLVGLGCLLGFSRSQHCIPLPQITSQYQLFTPKKTSTSAEVFSCYAYSPRMAFSAALIRVKTRCNARANCTTTKIIFMSSLQVRPALPITLLGFTGNSRDYCLCIPRDSVI